MIAVDLIPFFRTILACISSFAFVRSLILKKDPYGLPKTPVVVTFVGGCGFILGYPIVLFCWLKQCFGMVERFHSVGGDEHAVFFLKWFYLLFFGDSSGGFLLGIMYFLPYIILMLEVRNEH